MERKVLKSTRSQVPGEEELREESPVVSRDRSQGKFCSGDRVSVSDERAPKVDRRDACRQI